MRLCPEYHTSSSAYRGWSSGGGVYGFAAAVFCASARPAKPRRALVEHLVRKESHQRAGSFLQRRPRASRPPVGTSGISGCQCDNRPTRPLPAGMRQKRPPSGRTNPLYAHVVFVLRRSPFFRWKGLYFGAYDPKGGGVVHGACVFGRNTTHHRPHIVGGLLEEECTDLLRLFFARLRDRQSHDVRS